MPKSSWVCISISRPWLREEADHVVGVEGVEDAQRVAEAQAVGALVFGGPAEAQQELEVGARGVFGVDRDVQAVLFGEGHALADLVEHPLPRLGELVLDVDVAGRHGDGHGVDTAVDGVLDVGDDGPVPGEDRGFEAELDDLARWPAFSSPQHGGDADLDLMHADLVQQLGDADLLVVREDDAGGLLAVAQGGVVDAHRRSFGRRFLGDDEAGEVARHEVTHARSRFRSGCGPGVRRLVMEPGRGPGHGSESWLCSCGLGTGARLGRGQRRPDELADELGVGFALGGLHDLADEEAGDLLLAGAELLDLRRVRGEQPAHGGPQRARVGDLAEAVARHDVGRLGRAPRPCRRRPAWRPCPDTVPSAHEAQRAGQPRRR